jgi:hypothetical protein
VLGGGNNLAALVSYTPEVESLIRSLADVAKQALQKTAVLGRAIADAVARGLDLIHTADILARRYRWGISASWAPALILQVGELAQSRCSLERFEAHVLGFYEANDWEQLSHLLEVTCAYKSLSSRRKRILRDALRLLRSAKAGRFDPATWLLPALFAQLEGVLRDYAQEYPALKDSNPRTIIRSLRPYVAPIERPALRVIYDHVFRDTRRRPAKHKRVSRNLHLHGLTKAPATMPSVIRVILMINLVAYLIDARAGVQSKEVAGRAFWALFLSQTKKTAQKYEKLKAQARPSTTNA